MEEGSAAFAVTIAPRPRVLAVDDDPVNLRLLCRIFGQNLDLMMASSGAEALEVCRRERPDLILLDIVMGGLDGLEVCRQLKVDRELCDIPVIFITGRTSPEEESEGLSVGAVDFISKPINPAVVRARVQTHLKLKMQADLLRQQIFIDGLTGVSNRRRLDEMLDLHWRSCLRHRRGLSVFMIDVDHFKAYNDHFGHPAGDECLRRVAQCFGSILRRSGDVVARYGGEEFVCLSVSSIDDEATRVAELLCASVEALALPHPRSSVAPVVTVSVGAACKRPPEVGSAEALMALADTRLYRAKREGRNRVVAADECADNTAP